MDLELNVSKKGLSTQEEVINEEYTLRYGHIFRGKSAYEYAVEGGFVGSEEEYEAYVGNIGNLSEEAKEATIEAKEATVDAQDAREQALVATDIAISASRTANQAAQDVTTAKEEAEQATERANEAATNANDARERAITAAEQAEDATLLAKDALGEVNASLEEFDSQRNNYVQNDTFTETFDRVVAAIDWIENNKVDKVEGKGLSTNDFTDEYKQKVKEFIIDTGLSPTSNNPIANSAVVNGLAGLAEGVSTTIGQVSEQLGAEIETKANKDEYYPDMSVGMSDNLVGRGDVQDAHINFRPSAGADNITDGAARIERIKGNSVVWNQMFTKINTETQNGVTCVNNGDGSYTVYTDGGGATAVTSFMMSGSSMGLSNHILLLSGALNNNDYFLFDAWNGLVASENKIYKSTLNTAQVYIMVKQGTIINEPVIFYPQFIDLTKMFGAGNEPTTVEEYLQRKPMNIEDEFAYNAGTLVDMKVDSLVSVGDNAWDEEWENGQFNTTTGVVINTSQANKQIRSKNLIKVLPNTNYTCTIPAKIGYDKIWCMLLDKDKEVITGYTVPNALISGNSFGLSSTVSTFTTPSNAAYLKFYCTEIYGDVYTNDICIHLEQSGYKNGKYYPYQQDVKDLSFISEAFPEGMRSTGSVCDEIRFNATKEVWEKVERVGVRAYAEGDAEDSSVITDGETTNYPLDNPTPTTINLSPNFNLDYRVWDFGTEEAIASVPSAPFRADIKYSDNFVDDIRKNKENIATNKANIAKNTSDINSKQDTLTLATKPNGNIVIGNLAGQTKEFMPATPSGDPMHYAYLRGYPTGSNTPKGLQYNEDTDRWSYMAEYGGLTDLTSGEVGQIFAEGGSGGNTPDDATGKWSYVQSRTNFINVNVPMDWGYVSSNYTYAFLSAAKLEVGVVSPKAGRTLLVGKAAGMFMFCRKMRRVIGVLDLRLCSTVGDMFRNCDVLEDVSIANIKLNMSFSDSPLLSKESLLYMIDNCASNVSFTITLHPDVYAKCTRVDEGEGQYIGEWWEEIDEALGYATESKNTNITLASA